MVSFPASFGSSFLRRQSKKKAVPSRKRGWQSRRPLLAEALEGRWMLDATIVTDNNAYYPNATNTLMAVPFNESETISPPNGNSTYPPVGSTVNLVTGKIGIFYTDERAMILGVSQATVTTSSGTKTLTDTVSPLTTDPGSVTNPLVGVGGSQSSSPYTPPTTFNTLPIQPGTDASGRPIFPSLYVTDITGLDPNSTAAHAGDWQSGGTPQSPTAVFGTWKSATETVDETGATPTVSFNVGSDPAKNGWNLGPGADPAPTSIQNQGFGAEAQWTLGSVLDQNGHHLVSGHSYRFYFIVHDGDQNKVGGDVGQAAFDLMSPVTPTITTTPSVTTTTGGQFATIGFWHNFGPTATSLGNSLASSYPNLFGAPNPYTSATLTSLGATTFSGLTDSQVAEVYENLWTPSGLQKNTYVQAFAVALGLYSTGGAGTFTVPSGDWAAFGITSSSGAKLPVSQILATVNNNFSASTGLFYGGDSTLTSEANDVLDDINSSGEEPGGTAVVSSAASLNDSATLSGGSNPTGTVTFYLFAPGVTPTANGGEVRRGANVQIAYYEQRREQLDPERTVFDTVGEGNDTVTVNGNGTYDTSMGNNPGGYVPTAVGIYEWVAVYSGDANNSPATSAFGSEPQPVGKQNPTILTTTPNVTAVTLGTTTVTLKDTAALSMGINPTGTITWNLYLGGTLVDTESAAVNGNGSYTTPVGYTLPMSAAVTGTYQWNATYSGDAENEGDSDINDASERTVVSPASPSIATIPGGTVVLGSGAMLTDSANLAGGYFATGTVTFSLYNPSHAVVYTDTVTVSGNGTYDTSTGTDPGGYLPAVTGTYQWVAVYSGDANNQTVTSKFGDEPEVVSPSPVPPSISTTPGSTVVLGSSVKLTDTATLSGGNSPAGT
ncbi:MAG TPA: hypothetical protein PK867_23580, partial [Pirellulales bacterium]|nr:hypothetical protein [Pirellulales bacterium]